MSGVELQELKALVPPPATVARPPWHEARGVVGFDFPADYRAFVDAYGGGVFARPGQVGLEVRAPHGQQVRPDRAPGFAGFVETHVRMVRPLFDYEGAAEAMWMGHPRPMYPDAGGLLSWGRTEVSDQLFWRTGDPDPDRWPVVWWSRHDGSSGEFEGGMVSFLLAAFTGRVKAFSPWRRRGLVWTMEVDWLNRY